MIAVFFFVRIFDAISSNLNKVLSINSSANIFVFGDFDVRHKGCWNRVFTYSGGTERPSEVYLL